MQKSLSSGVQETDDRPLLLTSRETAACLRISERTLWTLTDRGDIRCIRMGAAKRYPIVTVVRKGAISVGFQGASCGGG